LNDDVALAQNLGKTQLKGTVVRSPSEEGRSAGNKAQKSDKKDGQTEYCVKRWALLDV